MSLLYTLGWPGMLNLPCVIVDHVTREVYNPEHKLPLSKIHLNTTNNKYVELAAILKLFPPGKDKDAMHSFMSISSDFGMRKFFMDRHQRAYISLDTLLVYLVVYPYCAEFVQARAELSKYLQTFREIPCLRCGFINRDCRCHKRGEEADNFDIIGYASYQIDREIQTEGDSHLSPSLFPSTSVTLSSDGSLHTPIGTAVPQMASSSKTPMQSLLNNPQQGVATSIVNPTQSTSSNLKDKPTSKVTPVNVVNPLRLKPVMVDAACQTRANFDFSMKKRDKNNWENKNKDIAGELASKDGSAIGSEQKEGQGASLLNKETGGTLPLPIQSQPLVAPKPAVRISLWKLLDSDSSSDEDEEKKSKEKVETDKGESNKTEEKFTTELPKSLDFSNEPMETNSTEKLSEEEKLLLHEAEKLVPETKMDTEIVTKPVRDDTVENEESCSVVNVNKEDKSEFSSNDSLFANDSSKEKVMNNNDELTVTDSIIKTDETPVTCTNSSSDVNSKSSDVNIVTVDVASKTSEEPTVEISMFQALDDEKKTESKTDDVITDKIEYTNDEHSSSVENSPERKDSGIVESTLDKNDSVIPEDIAEICKDAATKVISETTISKLEARMAGKSVEDVPLEQTQSTEKSSEVDTGFKSQESELSPDKEKELTNEPSHMEVNLVKDTSQSAQESSTDADKEKNVTEKDGSPKKGDNQSSSINLMEEDEPLVINEPDTEEKSEISSVTEESTAKGKDGDMESKSKDQTTDDGDGETTHNKVADESKVKGTEEKKPNEKDLAETETKDNKSTPTEKKKEKKPFLNYKKWCHKFEYTPTGEKLFRCTFTRCGQCFDTKASAAMHNKVHGTFGRESAQVLQCFRCEYSTGLNKWFDMVRHLKFCHDEMITSKEYGCFLCGREFPDHETVTRHIDFHYSGRYKCVHCGNIMFTWKQVEEHIKDACENKDKKEKNLGCPYCPLVFHIRNMRNAHMLSHQDKGLVCAFCENEDVWENWKLLRKHYQQKHGSNIRVSLNPMKKDAEKNKAADAGKEPALKDVKHVLKIDIKKNPQCHVCDEEFRVMEDYEYHMRKKHDFVPYVLSVCETCEKTFKTMKMYEWHMRNTHADDIKCDQCDFIAKTQLMLKVHVQNQHTTKEHACTECGKAFEHYHQLRMHMARHALHTIYCCQICGEEFKRQKELRHHNNTVHPKNTDQPQQTCPDCDYSCFTKRAMESHIKKYHPRLAEEIEESEKHQPMQPEHSYFNTQVPAIAPTMPPPAPKVPRPKPVVRSGEGEGSLVIRLPKNLSKKYKKNKGRKRRYSVHNTDEPKELSEEQLEKRRIKRERKENMERLKILSRETCARSRTYDDFRAMKELFKSKELQHQASQGDQDGEEPPDPKKPRVSKYGRSITTKPLDDSFVPSVKFYSDQGREATPSEAAQYKMEKQKRADAIKKQRTTCGLFGVAPPDTWGEEDVIVEYPYSDHCYFMIEHAQTIPNNPASLTQRSALSRRSSDTFSFDESPSTGMLSRGMRSDIMSEETVDTPHVTDFEEISGQSDMQTIRIGPGGILKKSKNRKQKIQYRTGIDLSSPEMSGSGRGEFMPLVPSSSSYGDGVVPQGGGIGMSYGQNSQDIQEEIIEQDLIREVTEIAQKDPVLQDLINSMQQTAGQGASVIVPPSPQPSTSSGILINPSQNFQNMSQQESGFINFSSNNDEVSFQGSNVLSRHVTPPRSLNIQASSGMGSTTGGEVFSANLGSSSMITPQKLAPGVAQGTGLTPTKQNVLDFILSKAGSTELEDIDLNEDELKQLLNEHNRSVEQTQDQGNDSENNIAMEQGGLIENKDNDNGGELSDSMSGMAQDILHSENRRQSGANEHHQQIVTDGQESIERGIVQDNVIQTNVTAAQGADGTVPPQSDTTVQQDIFETVENPEITSVTPYVKQIESQAVPVGSEMITVESHQYNTSPAIESCGQTDSTNGKVEYQVIHKLQSEGHSVVESGTEVPINLHIGDDTRVNDSTHTQVIYQQQIPQTVSQFSPNLVNVQEESSAVQQPLVYQSQQSHGHNIIDSSTGISALIAASEISEQESAVANIPMGDDDNVNIGNNIPEGQIIHKQIQYLNEVGEMVSVQIAEPQNQVVYQTQDSEEQSEPQTEYQVEEQLVTTDQPQESSMISRPGGTITILGSTVAQTSSISPGLSAPGTTRRYIRTIGVPGNSHGQEHTIVKQVLQEPATVPLQQSTSQHQQYRTVTLGSKPRTFINTSQSASTLLQGQRPVSILGQGQQQQPRQSVVVRQYRGRGRPGSFQYRASQPTQVQNPVHRVVRMSSPNPLPQNQTRIVKLPSAGSSNLQPQQQSTQVHQQLVETSTGQVRRLVSIPRGRGQRLVRVVHRGRGQTPPSSTIVRPGLQNHFITRGSSLNSGIRIRAPVPPRTQSINMVRLQDDGQGGQTIVHVSDPTEMQ